MKIELGKNIINKINLKNEVVEISNKLFIYEYYNLKKNTTFKKKNLKSFTVFFQSFSNGSIIRINNKITKLKKKIVIQSENTHLTIEIIKGSVSFFLAGTKNSKIKSKSLKIFDQLNLYKVAKPWGYEIWINGRHRNYAFKKIFLKKNFQTSLQFHKFKTETNLLFNGKAFLVYKKNPFIKNLNITKKDLGLKTLNSIYSIHVRPNTIHRIKAKSNIILYEVSTPHLDDVIRLSDDTFRPNGLIRSEHS